MSTPTLRFLLDENVRIELAHFLKSQGHDVRRVPLSTADSTIASLSKKEKRILVTNDEDFCSYAEQDLFAAVWLRIPQNDPRALTSSFERLLAEQMDFAGRLIVLRPETWQDFPLGEKVEFE